MWLLKISPHLKPEAAATQFICHSHVYPCEMSNPAFSRPADIASLWLIDYSFAVSLTVGGDYWLLVTNTQVFSRHKTVTTAVGLLLRSTLAKSDVFQWSVVHCIVHVCRGGAIVHVGYCSSR